jgi:endonuclease YncB( thermonuclease family)
MIRVLLALAVLLAFSATAEADQMLGFPDKVTSGDTFALCVGRACKMTRLCGIQAPKKGEPDFEKSRVALISALGNNLITCIQVGDGTPCDGKTESMQGATIVAQCRVNGKDVAQTMVDQGLACDMVKVSGGAYSKDGKGKACP